MSGSGGASSCPRHDVRGYGAGHRRMEKRRLTAEVHREEADAEQMRQRHEEHARDLQALRTRNLEHRAAALEAAKQYVQQTFAEDRQYRTQVEDQERVIQQLRFEHQLSKHRLSETTAQHLLLEGEAQRLHTELAEAAEAMHNQSATIANQRLENDDLRARLQAALKELAGHPARSPAEPVEERGRQEVRKRRNSETCQTTVIPLNFA